MSFMVILNNFFKIYLKMPLHQFKKKSYGLMDLTVSQLRTIKYVSSLYFLQFGGVGERGWVMRLFGMEQ